MSVSRAYFVTLIIFCLNAVNAPAAADTAQCHKLATDPRENDSGYTAVADDKLDALATIGTCKKAIQTSPNNGRLHYQLARAYYIAGLMPESMTHLSLGAKHGYVLAQIDLFKLSEQQGSSVTLPDTEKASLLVHAAAQGDQEAQFILAISYFQGRLVPENKARAISMIKSLAAKTYLPAIREYGLMIENKLIEGIAPESAVDWYAKAANAGDIVSMVLLGNVAFGAKQTEVALQWYEEAAQRGSANGAYYAGLVLARLKGMGKDSRIYDYLKQAADAGHVQAYWELANATLKGSFPSIAPEKSLSYFAKAAELGSHEAKNALASIYLQGYSPIKKDLKKAEKWLGILVADGDKKAMSALAEFYARQKSPKAIKMYQKAIIAEAYNAYHKLGLYLISNKGQMKNVRSWLEQKLAAGASKAGVLLIGYDIRNENYQNVKITAGKMAKLGGKSVYHDLIWRYGLEDGDTVWFEMQKYTKQYLQLYGAEAADDIADRYLSKLRVSRTHISDNNTSQYLPRIEKQLATVRSLRSKYGSSNADLKEKIDKDLPSLEAFFGKYRKTYKDEQTEVKAAQGLLKRIQNGYSNVCGYAPALPGINALSGVVYESNRKRQAWRDCLKNLKSSITAQKTSYKSKLYVFQSTPIGLTAASLWRQLNDGHNQLINSISKAIDANQARINARNARINN